MRIPPPLPRTAPPHRRSAIRIFGRGLAAVGLAFLALAGWQFVSGIYEQDQLNHSWQREMAAAPPPALPSAPPSPPAPVSAPPSDPVSPSPAGRVDFAISVPKIDYFAAIQEGVTSGILYRGPGHYPTTPWPGQGGNVGVAAHNTYWIRFGELGPGDEVDLQTRYGTYHYTITGSRVVSPTDTTVLVPTTKPTLTLTTCYPLYEGALAPQRLAIFADQTFPEP